MPIKSIPLSEGWQAIKNKVEEEREKGGGVLMFKSESEKISYNCLLGFPCVYIEYEQPKMLNKTTVMERTSTVIEPWLGEGRSNMPNEHAARQIEYHGLSHLSDGYYIPWSVVDKKPKVFVENFLEASKRFGSNIEDFEIKDVCYLPRFIIKLERSDQERYLVYDFRGKKIETIGERLKNDPYYRARIEGSMEKIP